MKKKTPVQWLIDELSKPQYATELRAICDKALEIEKEMIIELKGEDYYSKTFANESEPRNKG